MEKKEFLNYEEPEMPPEVIDLTSEGEKEMKIVLEEQVEETPLI